MLILRLCSYACFVVSALCVVALMGGEPLSFTWPAISAAVIGIVLLAIDRALLLLSDMRNALVSPRGAEAKVSSDADLRDPTPDELANLSNRIDRMLGRG
jgi:hypothetical protein